MTVCKKCGNQNKDYYNYCSNDGQNLNTAEGKLMLREDPVVQCECGEELITSQSYCPNCGKLLSEIGMRTKTYRQTQKQTTRQNPIPNEAIDEAIDDIKGLVDVLPKILQNIISSIKNFDFVGFTQNNIPLAVKIALVALAATAVLPLILTIMSRAIFSEVYNGLASEGMTISVFKAFFSSVVSMSTPKNVIALSGYASMGIGARSIIIPLIGGECIYLGVKSMFKQQHTDNALPMAILSALIYSLMMLVVSLIARVSITSPYDDVRITLYASAISVIINSFIISFIAILLGLQSQKAKQLGTVPNIFKHNLRIVEYMLLAISIALLVFTYIAMGSSMDSAMSDMYGSSYNYGYNYGYNYMFQELLGTQGGILLFIIQFIVFIVISPYIFLYMQFVSFKALVMSFNIISSGIYLLAALIPIIMFLLIGRNIKTRYGEGRVNTVAVYSLCYTGIMFLLSYFSKIVLSGDISNLSNELSEIIPQIASIPSVSGNLGMSSLATVITTLILSSIFMYIGYKTKKVNQ